MNQNFGVIVWGHDTRLSALAAHPDHEIGFVTTGYDKMVTRSLFHQHFTDNFFVQKCFAQLFSSMVWLCNFLVHEYRCKSCLFMLMKLTTGINLTNIFRGKGLL